MRQGRHQNNFDLLRILAASQVLIIHVLQHLHLYSPHVIVNLLACFPGVPTFFVISGYLVSESFERLPLRTYAIHRLLRIYPGLWACLAVSIAIAALWGGVRFDHAAAWLLAQTTFVQFYNPEFLRGFGVGALNGALWTIPVELQFYLALPLIYAALRSNGNLFIAIALFAVVSTVFIFTGGDVQMLWAKITVHTLPVWLYIFLLGVALQRNREFVRRYLAGRLPLWLGVYLATEGVMFLAKAYVSGNYLNPLSATALALLVISAAHARPVRVPWDISYSLYLYHMPVLNAVIATGGVGSYLAGAEVLAISVMLAILSWLVVERPALNLKHRLG